MKIKLARYSDDGDSTLGLFIVDNKFSCYTLEDESREIKVKGETCIPIGTYDVIFQENITPMTTKYRKKYSWFDKHLMIKDVPNFKNVYIHIGNTDENTEGCILLGDQSVSNITKDGFIGQSKNAFKRNYAEICEVLSDNKQVTIEIYNV